MLMKPINNEETPGSPVTALGVPFRKKAASIVSDGETAGWVSSRSIFRETPEFTKSDAVRLRCERETMPLWAGTEAQRKFNRRSVRIYHGQDDFRAAVSLMGCFFESPVLDACLDFLRVRVKDMFENPRTWRCVEAAAAALIEKKTLSNTQVMDVIERAMGIPERALTSNLKASFAGRGILRPERKEAR